MIKLILVTLVAFYGILLIGGERADGEIVARQSASEGLGFSLASFVTPASAESVVTYKGLSDVEAVEVALAAGAAQRAGRVGETSLRGLIAAVEAEPSEAELQAVEELWYVSGTMVNLRAGPGTENPVVATLSLGTGTKVLSDPNADWIEIQTTDGSVSGWIFRKYLSDRAPG